MGNTCVKAAAWSSTPVHPHARGEHDGEAYHAYMADGSSPRPWGTPGLQHAAGVHHRFIPTPVGNTCSTHAQPRLMSVHPHARGEHVLLNVSFMYRVGSSPRPWGTLESP